MGEKPEVKLESLLNLDDLLQCPVCYEIPPGQIFQCNEGHHVCGGCKLRLDVCPVCRALFFGTRNYAMEELISNFRKMRSLKNSSKASGSGSSQSSTPAQENASEECENNANEDEDGQSVINNYFERNRRPPQACSGLFRCLCCKPGSTARLPAARLLNHLRYFHAPDLIEGRSENGEYLQAWQFATVPGKFVIAVRIADMGIFFLTIDITATTLCAWVSMAVSPWIAHEFTYTITICGNDREAIFSDSVWSVRSCEGTLKKRGNCLVVSDADALALTAPPTISGKLSVRRVPFSELTAQTSPRTVLRIANRVQLPDDMDDFVHDVRNHMDPFVHDVRNHLDPFVHDVRNDLEPFVHDIQDNVARLTQVFANLDRQASLLQSRIEQSVQPQASTAHNAAQASDSDVEPPQPSEPREPREPRPEAGLSRHARKRLKQRMRAALDRPIPPDASTSNIQNQPSQSRQNGPVSQPSQNVSQGTSATSTAQRNNNRQSAENLGATENGPHRQHRNNILNDEMHDEVYNGVAYNLTSQSAPAAPTASSSTAAQSSSQTGNGNRNKKKRRHRR
ncbi:uncharacterized protein LOC112043316 [Bicyclus anynana]|uniref:Uncharacterized protein LOC112043316 n=1 Tax=Bicyclus anynana TaxID=110368 RepID=A0A6J1MVC7_BICAN|nr:uncharacterized protein LOC112043316 [Bicyclus anynana]